jgi:hypothetical protein
MVVVVVMMVAEAMVAVAVATRWYETLSWKASHGYPK